MLVAVFPTPNVTAGSAQKFCDYDAPYQIFSSTQLYIRMPWVLLQRRTLVWKRYYPVWCRHQPLSIRSKGCWCKVAFPADTNIITYEYMATHSPHPIMWSLVLRVQALPFPRLREDVLPRILLFPCNQISVLHAGVVPAVCKSFDTITFNTWVQGSSTTATLIL